MYFKCLDSGIFGSNTYVIWNEGSSDALLIDAGVDPASILEILDSHNLVLKKIILTHFHFDHIYHLKELKALTHAQVYIHKDDAPGLKDPNLNGSFHFSGALSFEEEVTLLKDQDTLECAGLTFKVLHTPGHTEGGICLYVDDYVFSGDTLFKGSIGRTDLPGSKPELIIPSIKQKLFTLPPHTKVYPGHGPSSTIEIEIRDNLVIKTFGGL
jgi:hydroxyacylglutathione hydrolase